MKAIYNGQLATITEVMGNPSPTGNLIYDMDGVVLDDEMWVSFTDPKLIVDPTDAQYFAAVAGEDVPPTTIEEDQEDCDHEVDHNHCDREAHLARRLTGEDCPMVVCFNCGKEDLS